MSPHLSRRYFLNECGIGLGKIAAASLLTQNLPARDLAPKPPQIKPRAKAVWTKDRQAEAKREVAAARDSHAETSKPRGKGKPRREDGPRQFSSKPKKSETIDPDSPFAALAALKGK